MKTHLFQQLFIGFSLFFATVVTNPLWGQTQTKSFITFSIKKGFLTIKGEFKYYLHDIHLDRKIFGRVRVASVDTGNKKRDAHLQSEEWFDAATYPYIEMQSTKITEVSERKYLGTFDIKIKGKTLSKEISFTTEGNVFKMDFELSRKSFGVGSGFLGAIVGDNVKISIHLPIFGYIEAE